MRYTINSNSLWKIFLLQMYFLRNIASDAAVVIVIYFTRHDNLVLFTIRLPTFKLYVIITSLYRQKF